jgi:hypothetical protein
MDPAGWALPPNGSARVSGDPFRSVTPIADLADHDAAREDGPVMRILDGAQP